MRVCIHRGAQEIGGTCIEVESRGKRIVLDVGLPLDTDPSDVELHPIPGFDSPDPSLLGVVISHPHQDHYGLAHRLPGSTPYLIGEAAGSILAAAEVFSPAGITLENTTHLQDRQPIVLGPFTITPYLVDHSAYDAYAVLVEADGKRLFYTGDIRAHGRKGKLFERLVRDPPRDVDVLLMEGTRVWDISIGEHVRDKSESTLEDSLVEQFKAISGMPLVWCSGQNIDRLVSVFRACRRSGRKLIVDMYTAHVLRATGNRNIPQADWHDIRVFLPYFQKQRIKRTGAFDVATLYRRHRIYPEELAEVASTSVILFRPSMMRDLDDAGCLDRAKLVYSMWAGYLEREEQRPFLTWLTERGIPLEIVHTSGHAGTGDLRRLREAFPGAVVVPVHSEQGEMFGELFENALCKRDGEWWAI